MEKTTPQEKNEDERVNILLVDDKAANLEALEKTLEDLDENLIRASSGKEGLKRLLDYDVAMILLDVTMPEMDGFETASMIRQHKKLEHTPIIFITAINKSETHISKGYAIGAVDYLFKPFDPEILKSKVRFFSESYRQKRQLAHLLSLAQSRKSQLTGWDHGSVTAQISGVGPLKTRLPDIFNQCQKKYDDLMEEYLEALAFNNEPPRAEINELARSMGDLGSGPRDVVEIHMNSIENKSKNEFTNRAIIIASEGRLLAIELMGYLVDYYRLSPPNNKNK